MKIIMNVDLMRFVDKWMGIPLCFMLSLFNRLLRLFTRDTSTGQVRKILIIQMSERGAVILAYSLLVKLRELFPQVELSYVIFEDMQESIKLLGMVPENNIFTISVKSPFRFVVSTLRMIAAIRREKVDIVIDLELFSRISALISYLSGAQVRVGFDKFYMEGLYRGSFHTHRVVYNHLKHISLNFLSLAYALKEDPKNVPLSKIRASAEDIHSPPIPSIRADQEKILGKLKTLCPEIDGEKTIIVVNPNGSELLPLRRWPLDNYIKLIRKLLETPDVYVVITGSPSERKDAETICDALHHNRCINLAGKTTFRELVDLYHVAHLLVSNDSGPPNLASSTKIKALVFFGPETPACYKPLGDNIEAVYADFLCSPCVSAYNHRKTACRDNKCLQAISVEEVFNRIRKLLPQLSA